MLDGFRNGQSEEQVFTSVPHQSTDDFSKEFFAWCEKQVASWGYDEETSKKIKELEPKGDDLLKSGQYDKALPVWQEIKKLRPMDKLPHMRLASIYLKLKRTDDAAAELNALSAVEL